MTAADRLKAKRRRARERARPRAAKPTGPARARAVDRQRSSEPTWRPEDAQRAQFVDDDGYAAWDYARRTGMSPTGPRVVWNEFGHVVSHRVPGQNLFGWRM